MTFESPSLASDASAADPAYELKYLIDEVRAREVESWARRTLALDPFGVPSLHGAYRTTSLYFDTLELDVYHRTRSYKRRKFRVRRYGEASLVFLERKTRSGDRVAKRRSDISIQEIQTLARGVADAEWSGSWFHRRLLARGLLPASLIRYERMAYVGASPESPLRLTLDRRAEGLLTGAWELTPTDGWRPLIDGKVILELKFRHALPAPFKRLVESLKLTPGSVSKYRLCRDAFQDA